MGTLSPPRRWAELGRGGRVTQEGAGAGFGATGPSARRPQRTQLRVCPSGSCPVGPAGSCASCGAQSASCPRAPPRLSQPGLPPSGTGTMGTGDFVCISMTGGAPWGFRLQGGKEQQQPLQVAKVGPWPGGRAQEGGTRAACWLRICGAPGIWCHRLVFGTLGWFVSGKLGRKIRELTSDEVGGGASASCASDGEKPSEPAPVPWGQAPGTALEARGETQGPYCSRQCPGPG